MARQAEPGFLQQVLGDGRGAREPYQKGMEGGAKAVINGVEGTGISPGKPGDQRLRIHDFLQLATGPSVTGFFVTLGDPARRELRGRKKTMRFWSFILGGGPSMWFVLAFAAFTLGAAVGFARRPDPRRVDAVRSFSWATFFSIVCGVCLNLAAVGSKVPANPEWANSPTIHLIVMEGISESLAPAILGFMLLSLVWTLMAVGYRRLSRESLPG